MTWDKPDPPPPHPVMDRGRVFWGLLSLGATGLVAGAAWMMQGPLPLGVTVATLGVALTVAAGLQF